MSTTSVLEWEMFLHTLYFVTFIGTGEVWIYTLIAGMKHNINNITVILLNLYGKNVILID